MVVSGVNKDPGALTTTSRPTTTTYHYGTTTYPYGTTTPYYSTTTIDIASFNEVIDIEDPNNICYPKDFGYGSNFGLNNKYGATGGSYSGVPYGYLIGGRSSGGIDEDEILLLYSESEDDRALKTPKLYSASTLINDTNILITGGYQSKSAEMYSIREATSYTKNDTPELVIKHCMVTFEGQAWLIGKVYQAKLSDMYANYTACCT